MLIAKFEPKQLLETLLSPNSNTSVHRMKDGYCVFDGQILKQKNMTADDVIRYLCNRLQGK